jgi:succinate dehydrogenase cytochrome b subunit
MSTLISSLRTTLVGYSWYRGREGHYTFILHRVAGLGTLLFLIIHILDTSTVYFFPQLYDEAIQIYRSNIFWFLELLLVACVIFHGINGLRITWFDMLAPKRWSINSERRSVRGTLLISFILWLPAAIIMTRNMLIHNFGLFGG